jgi:hypothetical protein
MVATKLLSFCCCRQTMVANKLLSKTAFTMLFIYEYFFGILPHNVLQLDLAPSCTLTLMLMLPHKVQEKFCVFENWGGP